MSLRTASSSFTKRKRTYLTLETKLEILGRAESGEGSSALGRMFGVGESTIRSIKKNADKIKNSVLYSSPFSGTVTRIGNTALKRTEKALGTWITKQLQNKKFTLSTICIRDKALAIYERFAQDQGGSYEPFVASKGWLNNFLKRTGFDSLKVISDLILVLSNIVACLHNFNECTPFFFFHNYISYVSGYFRSNLPTHNDITLVQHCRHLCVISVS